MCRYIQRTTFLIALTFLSIVISARTIVPFELINGLIIVEAEVNGEIGNYILDSGSNGVLLNKKSDHSNLSYQTLTGTVEGSETKINSIKLGNFHSKELLGFTTDLSNLEIYINKSLAGILSCSVFHPCSIEFNFSEQSVVVSDKEIEQNLVKGMSSINYSIIDDIPVGELWIGGNVKYFMMDTGASCHFFDNELISTLSSKAVKTGVSKSIITASGESSTAEEYLVSNFTDGLAIDQLKVFSKDFSKLEEELGQPIDGLLSLSKLSKDKVYFDIINKKIFF